MRKSHLFFSILILSIGLHAAGTLRAQGPSAFVSTFNGHQVLNVNGTTGVTNVIYTGTSTFIPEGMVVGQDNKIYICSSNSSQIWRINQDGTQPEKVFDAATTTGCTDTGGAATTCPAGSEGPSVSTTGDLIFNTRDAPHTGVWKLAGIFSVPFGGPFPAPHQVLTNAAVPSGTGSTFGEGTIIDSTDALLVVDRSGSTVVRSVSPFTTTSLFIPATEPTGTGVPVGIGLDNASDVFVANEGTQDINRFSSGGGFLGAYFTFGGTDRPFFHQFDASNRLFVATNDGSGANAKVWRIDPLGSPPSSGIGTVLIDLGATFSACTSSPPTCPVPGLASGEAVGLALPPTTFSTAQQAVFPGALVTFVYGNVINQTWSFPADAIMGSPATAFMSVDFIQVAPVVFNLTRLPGIAQNPNWSLGTTPVPAGTAITPIAGTGGNSILMRGHCFDANHNPIVPCNISAPTALIELTSKYETQSPQPNAGMIIGDDQGTPNQNDWANIANFFDPTDPRIGGGTAGTTVEVAIVNLGGTTPSFTYNACLLYDPTHAVKSGAAIPIKISLCDTSGRALSSADIVVHAAQLVQVSSGTTDTIVDAGDSNAPDNDFRFDPSLGTRGGYIFNLKTTGLATGTYDLSFTAGFDTTLHLIGAPPLGPGFTFQVK